MESSPRLHVGNLPYVAQKSDVERLFAVNKLPIKNIDKSIDPFTGRNSSYCFVDFFSQDHADQALQSLQGQMVRGRPVEVNLHTERKSRPGRERPPPKSVHRGWRSQEEAIREMTQNACLFDRWSRDDAESHWIIPMEEGRRLWVGGLTQWRNQKCVDAEMQALFQGWNIEAVSKRIPQPGYTVHQPDSHYYCFVDLPSEREAEDAMIALDEKRTPKGGHYRIRLARWPQLKPTKVMREQLGVRSLDELDVPERNLEGSWHRSE